MAETGHAKNVENLQKAIGFATGWGASYAEGRETRGETPLLTEN